MHRLAATPGGWSPESGTIIIDQTPAPIVFLTAADTDIQTLALGLATLPPDFPAIRVANLLNLQQEITIDTYAETVLSQTQVILLRLLGGRSYWSYGLEVCKQLVNGRGKARSPYLIVLPGDDNFALDVVSHSNVGLSITEKLWRYFMYGGIENISQAMLYLANTCLDASYEVKPPQSIPNIGLYSPSSEIVAQPLTTHQPLKAGILFYRAHYLAGNLAPIDALIAALNQRNITTVPVFIYSLQDPNLAIELKHHFQDIDILINTTSFSLTKPNVEIESSGNKAKVNIWKALNVPILQVILSGSSKEQWQNASLGLSPRDVAMNVALPEVDGRIITRAISFKSITQTNAKLETDIVVYEPVSDRVNFVGDLAANWIKLRRKLPQERRIALILANYPTRNGRLANGVGLDTPASCINLLQALQAAGYSLSDIPLDGNELIQRLTCGVTNDPESQYYQVGAPQLEGEIYEQFFNALPSEAQTQILERWGGFPAQFPIAGIQLGNIFVGIQPARGYDLDPSLNYHAPDLEPTHAYLAFYLWIRQVFEADAIAHIGKHGNLEWLPGKGLALSSSCFPEIALGALPHLYPFIVNDPGEGSQAKRRAQAVIIDHLTPPMTRAETYGELQKLEHLIDEYYDSLSLDPSRTVWLQEKIQAIVKQENLQKDLQELSKAQGKKPKNKETINQAQLEEFDSLIAQTDSYLCELKEAQIRDGLHILGVCPQKRQLRDLIVAITRNPGNGRTSILTALTTYFRMDFDPLRDDLGTPYTGLPVELLPYAEGTCRTVGDAITTLENYAANLVEKFINAKLPDSELGATLSPLLHSIYSSLQQTDLEIINFLRGLNGEYVPSGPSGAPTRGRLDVLPTGKNFYSVDIRAIPTETAWDIGRRSAELLIETYTQEHGEYPRTLGLSVWGTSTMRTGGDDIAEALALLGVEPVWDGISRRVVDFRIISLSALGRPRVDVTLRISGFFRDGFANLIDLFHQAVEKVAQLDEPDEMNPLKAHVRQDREAFQRQGLPEAEAIAQASYRIFGSKPNAYGAGLQGLIESQNWETEQDLAKAYLNWSSYAYTGHDVVAPAAEAFQQRLSQLEIVLHNQDNREHDLLDSDDYYQFQGGMTVAVRALTGNNPQTYFGDHSRPQNLKLRSLSAEINRVYRSRVVNPKWIAGVMRHGYKGAFEMAATLDYLFAYDATTNCVEDFMYTGVAQAYLLDPQVQKFVLNHNPWALRDMAERLLEAHQRQLWTDVPLEILEQLRSLTLTAEAQVETQMQPAIPTSKGKL